MNIFLKILSSLLLIFNGAGAIYGGLNLILFPDGSSIQLSPDWLEHTPFHDYFIPGIILFIANGLFSVFVLTAMILKRGSYPWLIIAQGAILTGWIIIQIMLIRTVYFLHVILGAVGISLILFGWILKHSENHKQMVDDNGPGK